jgi:HSP20 family protein
MDPRDRDDRDRDPFEDVFRELNRMMNEMIGDDMTGNGFGDDVHVTTQEDDEYIYVLADLPGVDKDDIDVKCDGRTITIAARAEGHQYEERLRLPAAVDEHSARATFNNGVLEVVFDRADSSASIDLS